jgi:hypothetical protein
MLAIIGDLLRVALLPQVVILSNTKETYQSRTQQGIW